MAVAAIASSLLAVNAKAITATTAYDTSKSVFSVYPKQQLHLLAMNELGFGKPSTITLANDNEFNLSSTTPTPAPVAQADAFDFWIQKLIRRESNGDAQMKIIDSNGRYSYGCLQFQLETFKSYVIKYELLDAGSSDDFYRSKIFDCNLQKQLARWMIAEDYENWRHWWTSVRKTSLGLPPKPSQISLAN